MNNIVKWFRIVAIAEGISFLILLGIAMPLKYFAGFPIAVTIVGGIHGLLFIAFMILAWEVKNVLAKPLTWYGKAFIASVLPFGTFVFDRQFRNK